MWHQRAVDNSLSRYQAALTDILNVAPAGPLRDAAEALTAFNTAAAAQPRRPLAGFSAATLAAIPNSAELTSLINEFSLGYGRPSGGVCERSGDYKPGIIIIGTEHAYDPSNLSCLAVESCGLSAAWKANATSQELADLASNPDWAYIPHDFCRNPSQHFGARKSGHTWLKTAYVITGGRTMAHATSMFERAYMMEISSYPAKRQANGRPVGAARLEFLSEIFSDCGTIENGRLPVSTLWFHGVPQKFKDAREKIIQAFFGLPQGHPLPNPVVTTGEGHCVLVYQHAEKLVVLTFAAAHFVAATYWDLVRGLIQPRVC